MNLTGNDKMEDNLYKSLDKATGDRFKQIIERIDKEEQIFIREIAHKKRQMTLRYKQLETLKRESECCKMRKVDENNNPQFGSSQKRLIRSGPKEISLRGGAPVRIGYLTVPKFPTVQPTVPLRARPCCGTLLADLPPLKKYRANESQNMDEVMKRFNDFVDAIRREEEERKRKKASWRGLMWTVIAANKMTKFSNKKFRLPAIKTVHTQWIIN